MQNFFYVYDHKEFVQILFSDIRYIESLQKYVRIFSSRESHVVSLSLNQAEMRLPPKLFCRIHRSYIISLQHTKRFDNETAHVGDKILPIGRLYRNILQNRVEIWGKCLKEEKLMIENSVIELNKASA